MDGITGLIVILASCFIVWSVMMFFLKGAASIIRRAHNQDWYFRLCKRLNSSSRSNCHACDGSRYH